MSQVICLFIGAAIGFIVGFLFFRNNSKRLQKTEIDIKNMFKKEE